MAKIYISSTYEDLEKEREAAAEAVRRLGHTTVAMENYVAADIRPLDKCLEDVRTCDVYVGIFAWRYGHIPDGYYKSITHLEYEEAQRTEKECLIFLLDEEADWSVKKIDKGEKRDKIERLRSELQERHIVSFFKNADQLSGLVSPALSRLLMDNQSSLSHSSSQLKKDKMKDKETKDTGRDVFISYASDKGDSHASRDRQAADRVYEALETEGIRCWVAHRDILPGDDWLESIIDAVEKSQVLVLVFSANANNSKWVKDEITMALDEDIKIIPFRIDDVSPRGGLRILKYRCQWLDAFTSPIEEHIGKLVNVVCRHLGKEPKIAKKSKVNEQPEAPGKKIPIPKEMPEDVRKIAEKIGVQKVIINDKGFWEDDYGDGIIMVYIPAGEFTMGSNDYDEEKPIHTVYLDGYWMGKTVVTVGQFGIFVEENRYITEAERGGGAYTWTGINWEQKEGITWKNPGFEQDDNHPVVCVSWNDAQSYFEWLSNKKRLSFKLSTEAQWEKTARGTDSRKFPWGNREPDETLANFGMRSGKTSPVGSYPNGSSPYGLLDMAGNVWEWCNDWYDSDYYGKSPERNPQGPESGPNRVIRGGSWSNYARTLRCADRYGGRPSGRGDFLGFRLCHDNR